MTAIEPVELPNGDLVIPLDGCVVSRVCINILVEFDLHFRDMNTKLSMCYFEINVDDAVQVVSAETRNDWPAVFDLLGLTVAKCHISNSTGIITLDFNGGTKIRVLPLEKTEHWEMVIGEAYGYQIISLPGEGIMWWGGPDATSLPLRKPESSE